MATDPTASFSRLLSLDPLTGTKTIYHYDAVDEAVTITYDQPDAPILDATKRAFNDARSDWKGDIHHVASLPTALYWDLHKQGYFDKNADPQLTRLRKWLNDPDNRFFRVKPGRV